MLFRWDNNRHGGVFLLLVPAAETTCPSPLGIPGCIARRCYREPLDHKGAKMGTHPPV